MNEDKTFKILALDGGVIRGIYSTTILSKIAETYKIKLKERFDLIVGTSTGSILGSAIACDIQLSKVINMYEEKGKLIFNKNLLGLAGLFKSKYDNKKLSKILRETFGNITLGEINKPLMIIASDTCQDPYDYKLSKYDKLSTARELLHTFIKEHQIS